MKKSSFVAMMLGTIGGLLFSLGMCMALIPEWNAFKPGVGMGAAGAIVLFITVLVWRKMEGKSIAVTKKMIVGTLIAIVGAFLLGAGMYLILVFNYMVPGILIGIAGIVVMLCLIPYIKGLK